MLVAWIPLIDVSSILADLVNSRSYFARSDESGESDESDNSTESGDSGYGLDNYTINDFLAYLNGDDDEENNDMAAFDEFDDYDMY